jgi:biopolymer transport protein ExbD
MRRRSNRHHGDPTELNITAFMNLMVALVPFLLVTAVFSQVSVHDLNLPPISNTPALEEPAKKPIVLEVILYKNRMELVDRQSGPLKVYPNTNGSYDFPALVSTLKAVKLRFPEVTDITVLLEQDTPYDALIQTMDNIRITTQEQDGKPVKVELFPDISIGDAPPDVAATAVQGVSP